MRNGHGVKAKEFKIRITGFAYKRAREFHFNPLNWRRHGHDQREALRTMLGDVGWVQGVIENKRTGNLIDGHARIEEVIWNDPDQLVPYIQVDLSEAEEKAVLATLDPIGAMAEIDPVALDQLFQQTITDMPELEQLLNGLHYGGAGNGAGPDLPDASVGLERAAELKKKWRVKEGDLWTIGDHRLLCGDATNASEVARLFADQTADLCFTSPPYLAQREYKNKLGNWDQLMQGVFTAAPLADGAQVLVNLGLIYRAGEWAPYWDQWIEWMRAQGWRRFGWYVWDQGPGLPGDWNGRAAPAHEFIFHFNRASSRLNKTVHCKHAGERNHGHGLRKKDGTVGAYSHAGLPVQAMKVIDSVVRVVREKNSTGIQAAHSAPFPVGLPAEMIAAFSDPDEVIYDPFVGSGTTLVAAAGLQRRGYATELSPDYVALCLERLAVAFPDLPISK